MSRSQLSGLRCDTCRQGANGTSLTPQRGDLSQKRGIRSSGHARPSSDRAPQACYLRRYFIEEAGLSYQVESTAYCFVLPCPRLLGRSTVESRQPAEKCEAILGQSPAGQECSKVFAKDAGCCIQYDAKRLASRCERMSTIEFALTCFSAIHEDGFRKTELLSENEPGLGARFAAQWKRNVMRICSAEKSNKLPLTAPCCRRAAPRSSTTRRMQRSPGSPFQKPIFQFCRKTFGDCWEGVEDCVKKQQVAKRRLGQ